MRAFELDVDLQLALITLGVFLVGVLAAVILLIGTMTTPLRFPGGSRPDAPEIDYATSFDAGQVYFNEIASGSLAQWHRKWQKEPARLWRERNESLVRETHNLAVRAEHKYARTNEAVAVLSFALLSFALSVVLVLTAAAGPSLDGPEGIDAVPVDWRLRLALAVVLLSYCWLQLRGSARGEFQSVADLAPFAPGDEVGRWTRWSRENGWVRTLAYPLSVALVPAALVAVPSGERWGAWLVVLLSGLAVVLLVATLPWQNDRAEAAVIASARREAGPGVVMPGDTPQDEAKRRHRKSVTKKRNIRAVLWASATALVIGGLGATAICHGWAAVQLFTAYLGTACLLIASLMATITRQRRRVAKYAKQRDEALKPSEPTRPREDDRPAMDAPAPA